MAHLHGKGQSLRDDVINFVAQKLTFDEFTKKHGVSITNLIFDNFIKPFLATKDSTEEMLIVAKLDLFCASFYEALPSNN